MPDAEGLRVSLSQPGPIPLAVELACAPHEVVALIGPSGSGKTTILRAVAGLYRPAEGEIRCNGVVWLDTKLRKHVEPQRRRVGLVFQDYALFPHLTALDNVRIALGHVSRGGRGDRARELLEQVRLAGLEHRRPADLSGGQRQRVALARALAREPAVLLLDEPFSAVDQMTREKLIEELALLRLGISVPTLLVTHDLSDAGALADRMYIISKGRTLQSGPPLEITTRPVNREVARLVGQRNLFRGRVLGGVPGQPQRVALEWAGRRLEVETKGHPVPTGEVDWMVPPSHVVWHRPDRWSRGESENPVRGVIGGIAGLGDTSTLTLLVDGRLDHRLFFKLPTHVIRRKGVGTGQTASVSLLADGIHLMPPIDPSNQTPPQSPEDAEGIVRTGFLKRRK